MSVFHCINLRQVYCLLLFSESQQLAQGTHTAMKSGMLAAEAAFDALTDASAGADPVDLAAYEPALRESWVGDELSRVRNIRPGCALNPADCIRVPNPFVDLLRQGPYGLALKSCAYSLCNLSPCCAKLGSTVTCIGSATPVPVHCGAQCWPSLHTSIVAPTSITGMREILGADCPGAKQPRAGSIMGCIQASQMPRWRRTCCGARRPGRCATGARPCMWVGDFEVKVETVSALFLAAPIVGLGLCLEVAAGLSIVEWMPATMRW